MQLLLYTPDSSAESQVFSRKPFFSGRIFRTFYPYITVFSSKKPKQAEKILKNYPACRGRKNEKLSAPLLYTIPASAESQDVKTPASLQESRVNKI